MRAGGETMEKGRIYTTEFVSDDETLACVDRESQSSEEHILLFSRLPHRRLLEHLDINAVEAYWLTERVCVTYFYMIKGYNTSWLLPG